MGRRHPRKPVSFNGNVTMGPLHVLVSLCVAICMVQANSIFDRKEQGRSKRGPSEFIVGGNAITPYSRNFLIQLGNKNDLTSQWCGATAIDDKWVVTAAHCVEGWTTKEAKKRMGITAAQHNLLIKEKEKKLKLKKLYIHEGYNRKTLENDIALLELKKPMKTSKRVGIIPINTNKDCPAVGTKCMVIGWGNLSPTSNDFPDVPHEVNVTVWDNADCQDAYRGEEIFASSICAGEEGGGKDSCQGDSGGPFVCECDGELKLVGVVSWGYGCAQEGNPGVYVRVSELQDWIADKMT